MTKKLLKKNQIEQLIAKNDPSLTFLEKEKKTKSSEWWNFFHVIHVNNERQQYVSCNACKSLLLHISSHGTNNLRSHAQSCTKIQEKSIVASQKTVRDFFSPSKQSSIPKRIKSVITKACTEFCALDGRAFDVMKGIGFQDLSIALLETGRLISKASIDIKDLLPHPTTISRNISEMYDDYKDQLIGICKKLNDFCIVVDQWTESYTGIGYCGIVVRYVDKDHRLFSFILGCYPYNAVSQSSQHIREFVNNMLEEYHLKLDETKFIVTDNEPKMLAAFKDECYRIGCSDHYLNKQLQHSFESEKIYSNKNTFEYVSCDLAQNIFNQVKTIVGFVRRSHQQQKLSKKLQSYSETRFAGAIIMLNVFKEVFFELPEILINTKSMVNYNTIEKQILDDLCKFLDPFQEVLDALSEDEQPSLHRVIPLRQMLIKICEVEEEDSTTIIELKIFLERRIKCAWYITDFHRLATILHPCLKNFDFCEDEKVKSINALKRAFDKLQSTDLSLCTNATNSIQINSTVSSPKSSNNTKSKRKNILFQCFDSKSSSISTPSSNPYQEIDNYLNADFSENIYPEDDVHDDIDVLSFWHEKQSVYPCLSKIARQVCSIPASNTSVERLFSAAKNVVTEKRTRLGSEKINQILFLQKNMNLLKELNESNKRKRTISTSSTITASSEEAGSTVSKQPRLDIDDTFDDISEDICLD